MLGQHRTTKWKVNEPHTLPFLQKVPKELVDEMATDTPQCHYHNYVVTTDTFSSFRSLSDSFHIVAVDDATP